MTRAQDGKPAAMMLIISILLVISYLTYIMLIHPWDRRALLTTKADLRISVADCESGFPISNARVQVINNDGEVLLDNSSNSDGLIYFSDWPDCYVVKPFFGNLSSVSVCLDTGESRVLSLCYNNPVVNPDVFFYEGYVGLVGGFGGGELSVKDLPNIILSYPLRSYSLSYPSSNLLSNIFWSESFVINASDVNNLTDSVKLNFTVKSVRGLPKIVVVANGLTLFNDRVVNGEVVSVSVPRADLSDNLVFTVKCVFSGYDFWNIQACDISNATLTQFFYLPVKRSQVIPFKLSPFEANSSNVVLNFKSNSNVIGGLTVNVNGVPVFNANSLTPRYYSSMVNADSLSLGSDNNVTFIAQPGAELLLSEVNLTLNSDFIDSEVKSYEFSLDDYSEPVYIKFFVNQLLLNGLIRFNVNGDYYVYSVAQPGWNSVKVNPESLSSDNSLVIDALDGRFELGELEVVRSA